MPRAHRERRARTPLATLLLTLLAALLACAQTAEAQSAGAHAAMFDADGGAPPTRGPRVAYRVASTPVFALLSRDFGPQPRFGVVRHEVDARVGVSGAWLDGRLAASIAVRTNLFDPDEVPLLATSARLEPTHALMLEAIAVLDLRDDPRAPRDGVFLRVGMQQAGLGGASSWDYFRITAEARAYASLGGIVLAARFAIGAMFVFRSYGLDAGTIYDLDELGPLSLQLQGGGARSHRGFARGGLGSVRRPVPGEAASDGSTPTYRPALIAGGTRRWEGSLEVRIPIGRSLRVVLFADVGDVARGDTFDLAALNLAAGLGLRYRTRIGVVRLEWAFRPDALQHLGPGGRTSCASDAEVECRPSPMLFGSAPGAFHLALGEAF